MRQRGVDIATGEFGLLPQNVITLAGIITIQGNEFVDK